MASKVASTAVRQVKPILSIDRTEAKRRVFKLYKAWYRQIPIVVFEYDVPFDVKTGRNKLRELFERNKHVTDVRTIDMLVIKGQMELIETVKKWKQKGHVMNFFKDTEEVKPQDFLSKFLNGQN